MKRAFGWILSGTLVVLCARWIAYALSPSPLARTLRHAVGGPRLPLVTLSALVVGLLLSSAIVWLAALGVRERSLLENRAAPPLRLGRAAVEVLLLSVATTAAFGLLESYIHWRAGLGWHGIHCLTGPVHTNALPVLASLSLVATAAFRAVEHVLAWMRRTVAVLRSRPKLRAEPQVLVAPAAAAPSSALQVTLCGARAPPLPAG
jgi:hypothetical protein